MGELNREAGDIGGQGFVKGVLGGNITSRIGFVFRIAIKQTEATMQQAIITLAWQGGAELVDQAAVRTWRNFAAEARAIEAVGRAEAEKMRMKASAYKQYGDAAIMSLVLEALPQVEPTKRWFLMTANDVFLGF